MAMTTVRYRLKRPIHLILDWDGTLSTNDTMSLLANLPQARDARLRHSSASTRQRHQSPAEKVGSQPCWSDFEKAYLRDYEEYKLANYPRQTVTSPPGYSRWLAGLENAEYRSAIRVSASGFFRGVRTEDVVKVVSDSLTSGALSLQPGWADIFALFLPTADGEYLPPTGSRISILSVNWCDVFIRQSLYLAASRLPDVSAAFRDRLCDYITGMEIRSNQIEGLDRPQGSSGDVLSIIRSARDKLEQMRRYSNVGALTTSERPVIVYVGDSSTDWECMKEADFGLWFCPCSAEEMEKRSWATFQPLIQWHTPSVLPKNLEQSLRKGRGMQWLPSLSLLPTLLSSYGE